MMWRIRYFWRGICNIIEWIPTLYNDQQWDSCYIFIILKKKLENTRNHLIDSRNSGFAHVDIEYDISRLNTAIKLIDKVKDEEYGLEYLDKVDECINDDLRWELMRNL